MQLTEVAIDQLVEAPWNPNRMAAPMRAKLRASIARYGLVHNLVVRPVGQGRFEVLSGNQRLAVLREMGFPTVPCVVAEVDDAHARLLAQALNRIQGEDDLGLKAELVQRVLEDVDLEAVLSLLPDGESSLAELAALGRESVEGHLTAWQQAQGAKLKTLTFHLTAEQAAVVEEALGQMSSSRDAVGPAGPNARGTALARLCSTYLHREEAS